VIDDARETMAGKIRPELLDHRALGQTPTKTPDNLVDYLFNFALFSSNVPKW
jgi:hypothetical protein